MSKPKQTVEKWVAWLDRPFGIGRDKKTISTLKINVVETDKQFRLEGDDKAYRAATAACGYKHLVNKSGNDCLFDTEMAALQQQEKQFRRQHETAQAKATDASENLRLITEAIASRY